VATGKLKHLKRLFLLQLYWFRNHYAIKIRDYVFFVLIAAKLKQQLV